MPLTSPEPFCGIGKKEFLENRKTEREILWLNNEEMNPFKSSLSYTNEDRSCKEEEDATGCSYFANPKGH